MLFIIHDFGFYCFCQPKSECQMIYDDEPKAFFFAGLCAYIICFCQGLNDSSLPAWVNFRKRIVPGTIHRKEDREENNKSFMEFLTNIFYYLSGRASVHISLEPWEKMLMEGERSNCREKFLLFHFLCKYFKSNNRCFRGKSSVSWENIEMKFLDWKNFSESFWNMGRWKWIRRGVLPVGLGESFGCDVKE